MSSPVPEVHPEPEEVVAAEVTQEQAIAAVPVVVEGPVRVQMLPATHWSTGSVTVRSTDPPVKLVDPNPMRKRIVISSDGAFSIGTSQGEAGAGFGQAGYGRGGIAYELTHQQAIWVWVTDSAGSTAGIGYIEEFWTG